MERSRTYFHLTLGELQLEGDFVAAQSGQIFRQLKLPLQAGYLALGEHGSVLPPTLIKVILA